MSKITSGITTSLDGYFVGPNDGPGKGLGEGGERLHAWVFGGVWRYDEEVRGEPIGADKEYLDEALTQAGAVIGGRATYEAADHWGGTNPWPVPFFILTHRPEEQPETGGFRFVGSLEEAIEQARDAAGDKPVEIMGGGETIREALRAGYIDEFTLTIAPIVLGAGKRLFEGFDQPLTLEPLKVWHSPLATHIQYRVVR
jgi:dihydrofolate reductase